MSRALPTQLPRLDRTLLRAFARLVPAAERADWSRSWHAELWHLHHRRRARPSLAVMADISFGLLNDALWLRAEGYRRTFSGTAVLCLATLLGLCTVALFAALTLAGTRTSLTAYLLEHLLRTAYAAPLVIFVIFATAPRRHLQQRAPNHSLHWMKRQLFLVSKAALLLLLTFLLSADLSLPLHATGPNYADFLQLLSFVILSLLALRWCLADQETRCKHCLHALATPARVGRPSRNLLEWNGTELLCKHGHGLLSIPEMETSWCQSSQWIIPA
jgi:hypothetical protein